MERYGDLGARFSCSVESVFDDTAKAPQKPSIFEIVGEKIRTNVATESTKQ